jgi:hypothetical protein
MEKVQGVITMILQNLMNTRSLIYSAIACAGVVYLYKNLFSRKPKRKFNNNDKKKFIRKFNLLFSQICGSNGCDVVKEGEEKSTHKLNKIKNYCEKMKKEISKTDEKELVETTTPTVIENRRDKIFFYIFNNVSTIIAKSNNNIQVK